MLLRKRHPKREYEKNPIQKVRTSSARLKDPEVLPPQEFRRLLGVVGVREQAMIMLAGSTGLRRSEMFALRWSDICFEAQEIRVVRGIVRNKMGDVKTPASRKPVPLHQELALTLHNWRSVSVHSSDDDFVFASVRMNGAQPLFPCSVLNDYIRPAAVRAGITKTVGWHTFRHSLATNLRSLGVDVKVAQELLRHANSRTTLDFYTQAIAADKRQANARTMSLLTGSVSAREAEHP